MSLKIQRVSSLFQPLKVIPKNASVKNDNILSNSQKLMIENGIIRQSGNGMFYILPLGLKALEKLIKIVDMEMRSIKAQKVLLPILTDSQLWKKSGRWDTAASELFKIKDRHNKEYLLSPTHEESMASLIASVIPLSRHDLPLRIYQISSKFRDEKKSRFGLIRGKEFIMKDLYSFDSSLEGAKTTYDEVCDAYNRVFDRIGVKYIKVLGNNGEMGGNLSHEYHYPANIGEDSIFMCDSCGYAANKEMLQNETCPSCNKNKLQSSNGIEVGHTFLLGTKYSEALGATITNSNGENVPMEMGSYGLGLTRILAASIEALSPPGEIHWPLSFAPYIVCIITPKDGSNEESVSVSAYQLYKSLNSKEYLNGDVIIDDRGYLTIGKRLLFAKKTGYPFVVVVGRRAMMPDPVFEVFDLLKDEQKNLTLAEIMEYFEQIFYGSNAKSKTRTAKCI